MRYACISPCFSRVPAAPRPALGIACWNLRHTPQRSRFPFLEGLQARRCSSVSRGERPSVPRSARSDCHYGIAETIGLAPCGVSGNSKPAIIPWHQAACASLTRLSLCYTPKSRDIRRGCRHRSFLSSYCHKTTCYISARKNFTPGLLALAQALSVAERHLHG